MAIRASTDEVPETTRMIYGSMDPDSLRAILLKLRRRKIAIRARLEGTPKSRQHLESTLASINVDCRYLRRLIASKESKGAPL